MERDGKKKSASEPGISRSMVIIARMITHVADSIPLSLQKGFVNEILRARRIFTIGAGRSGLVASAFAMRLMHLRFATYVIGETILPPFLNERMDRDVLIIFSGSGTTGVTLRIAEAVKEQGCRICLITKNASSRLNDLADCTVVLAPQHAEVDPSIVPMGTTFEIAAFVFSDAVIADLIRLHQADEEAMSKVHANLMGLWLLPEDDR